MTLNFIFIGSSGGLFIHIKQSAAGASLKSPSYDRSHLLLSERPCVEMCVRRWIWGRIGCNRSRVKNIADGNKRSSYVFLAVWISLQCNFSGKSFCLFLISTFSSAVCTHAYIYTRAQPFPKKMFSCNFFFYASLIVRGLSLRGWVCCLSLLKAFCARCSCCEIKYRYTHTRVQLHWIMNELTCFFSDDNRDECHLGVIWLLRCARCEDPSPDFILESLGYVFSSLVPCLWLI